MVPLIWPRPASVRPARVCDRDLCAMAPPRGPDGECVQVEMHPNGNGNMMRGLGDMSAQDGGGSLGGQPGSGHQSVQQATVMVRQLQMMQVRILDRSKLAPQRAVRSPWCTQTRPSYVPLAPARLAAARRLCFSRAHRRAPCSSPSLGLHTPLSLQDLPACAVCCVSRTRLRAALAPSRAPQVLPGADAQASNDSPHTSRTRI